MYGFDNNLKSVSKFPVQYDGRWLVMDWYRHIHKFVTLTKDGKLDKWFDFPVTGMLSDIGADYGPDGALYVLQYSQSACLDNKAALYHIAYTGPHDCAVSLATGTYGRPGSKGALVSGFQPITLPADAEGLEIFDLSGRKAWTYLRNGAAGSQQIELPKRLASSMLRVRFM
jgi:hypothetical protein